MEVLLWEGLGQETFVQQGDAHKGLYYQMVVGNGLR